MNISILGLSPLFLLLHFYCFSFFGWIYESTYDSVRSHRLTNRGFLIGPIIPIYGFGATIVYACLHGLTFCPTLLYLGGMISATILEYVTAWLLEIIFHATWWDYSQSPYNYKGRIALIPSMFWGFLSLALFDLLEPLAQKLIHLLPEKYMPQIISIVLVCTAADFAVTVFSTINFRKQLEALYLFRQDFLTTLEDASLAELKTLVQTKTPNISERMTQFSEKFQQLKNRIEMESEKIPAVKFVAPKLSAAETKYKAYSENILSFIKEHPLTGNKRILKAFPNMTVHTKNKQKITVKDLIFISLEHNKKDVK